MEVPTNEANYVLEIRVEVLVHYDCQKAIQGSPLDRTTDVNSPARLYR